MSKVILIWILFLSCPLQFFPQEVKETSKSEGPNWLGKLPGQEALKSRKLQFFNGELILLTQNSILTSRDGGHSWHTQAEVGKIGTPPSFVNAWLSPTGELFAPCGLDAFVSPDIGDTWSQLSSGETGFESFAAGGGEGAEPLVLAGARGIPIPPDMSESIPKYAQDSAIGGSDKMLVPAILISEDKGQTWRPAVLPKAVGYLSGITISGTFGVAWGPYAVLASLDAGRSWKIMQFVDSSEEEGSYPVSASILGDSLRVSLENGRIAGGPVQGDRLSTVGHLDGELTEMSFISGGVGFGVLVVPSPKKKEWGDILMKTDNGGRSWTPVFHSEAILALSIHDSDLYGVTEDRAFRIVGVAHPPFPKNRRADGPALTNPR